MIILPIFERELRAEARSPLTYWLRVMGAAALMATFAVMMLDSRDHLAKLGVKLFGNLNAVLFGAIWIFGPLLTADSISRERREGTLGLLFLTPLQPRAVVIGKSLIHALRAMSLLLAALPVLSIAVLLGGVGWREEVMALMLNLSAICLALGAGLLASSLASQWNRALLLAEVFAAFFLVLMGGVYTLAFVFQVVGFATPNFSWAQVSFPEFLVAPFFLLTDAGGVWSEAINSSFGKVAARQWLMVCGEMLLLSALVSMFLILVVARRVRDSWRRDQLSTRQAWWRQLFFSPCFLRSVFRGRMQRTLDRNPVGWLQQRTAAARLTKWGWCLFVTLTECFLVGSIGWGYFAEWQLGLLFLLALGLAASAAGSFQRERESGALELILVTPVTVPQIIFGRLRGIWGQFFPALALCVLALSLLDLTWLRAPWERGWLSRHESLVAGGMAIVTTFVATPLIGLHASLTRKHFLSAWLMTLGAALLFPMVFVGLCRLVLFWEADCDTIAFCSFQLALAAIASVSLFGRLSRRHFAPG